MYINTGIDFGIHTAPLTSATGNTG